MRREGSDKFMGRPMFPRLHVNDTEKGGPRAPPRNKMALYERLTILSQSHNSGGGGVAPTLNPNNSIGSVPFTSRSQGSCHERRMDLPVDQPSLPSLYSHTELQDTTEVVDLSNQPAQIEQGLKAAQKDDLVVPIFSQHGVGQCTGTTYNSGDGERLLNNSDKKADHSGGDLVSRQHGINQGRRTFRVSDAPKRYLEISKRAQQGLRSGQQDNCTLSSSEETEVCLRQHLGNGLPAMETKFGEGNSGLPMDSTRKDISLRLEHNYCIRYACGESNGIDNGMQTIDDCSWETENVDRADDTSETSILDSASALDISAEDIVGIIGVKYFLRARSAIANQQRVLAAQVFELHRLIKVQGLIAGVPHLLKDRVFINKTSKDSNMKYSPEFSVKAIAHAMKNKDDPEDPYDKVECTAENAVSEAPPVAAPKSLPPVNTDPEMNSWSFHQPASHQWLLPMMCPSQGLVYRPGPAPGFMSPVLGGYGALGSTPAMGNFLNSAYGMPPGIHCCGQGYFHPCGMPIMSPSVSGPVMDQMNMFSQGHPHGQMARPGGVGTRCLSSEPIQKKGANMPGAKAGDLQRSTTISPSHQAQGLGTAHLTKCRDALPLSPVSTVTGVLLGVPSAEKSARVIRVVPRDRGSTKESAARIFRSIQEERQQQGSN